MYVSIHTNRAVCVSVHHLYSVFCRYVHMLRGLVDTTRTLNTWLCVTLKCLSERSLCSTALLSRITSETKTERMIDQEKYWVGGPAYQHYKTAHLCVCVCVCVCMYVRVSYVCGSEIGWQHVCHCSRTPLLLSGTADGCLSNASVSVPIHQLKQMLNADIRFNWYLPNFSDWESTSSSSSGVHHSSAKGAVCSPCWAALAAWLLKRTCQAVSHVFQSGLPEDDSLSTHYFRYWLTSLPPPLQFKISKKKKNKPLNSDQPELCFELHANTAC